MNQVYRICMHATLATMVISCNSSNKDNENTTDSNIAVTSDTLNKAAEIIPVAEENKLAPNEISLTQADFPVVVTVPEGMDTKKVKVEAQTWGGIEITAGDNFQVQIALHCLIALRRHR